jgi:hypothetical protein
VFAAIMALPALILAGVAAMAIRFMTSGHPLGGAPEKVPCAEALDFGGARLPKGAYEAECTVQVWLDTEYDVEFRMPRADVVRWLKRTYPVAPEPGAESCDDGADLCLHMNSAATVPPGVDADAVEIDVTYEEPATARVTFFAFTV